MQEDVGVHFMRIMMVVVMMMMVVVVVGIMVQELVGRRCAFNEDHDRGGDHDGGGGGYHGDHYHGKCTLYNLQHL